jgi:hypothetical protein
MFLCLVSMAFNQNLFDGCLDEQKFAAEEFDSEPNASALAAHTYKTRQKLLVARCPHKAVGAAGRVLVLSGDNP